MPSAPDVNLPTRGTVQDAKRESCSNCMYFDPAYNYCRFNPPVGAQWSKIDQPYIAWCKWWEPGNIDQVRELEPPLKGKSGFGGVK